MFRDLRTARVLSNTKSESNTAEIKAPGTRGFLRTSGMPEAEGFTGQQQCRKKGESIYLSCALNKLVMLRTPGPFPDSEQTSQALFPDREYFQPSSYFLRRVKLRKSCFLSSQWLHHCFQSVFSPWLFMFIGKRQQQNETFFLSYAWSHCKFVV